MRSRLFYRFSDRCVRNWLEKLWNVTPIDVSGYNIPRTVWSDNGGRDSDVAFRFVALQSVLNYPATIGVSDRLLFRARCRWVGYF